MWEGDSPKVLHHWILNAVVQCWLVEARKTGRRDLAKILAAMSLTFRRPRPPWPRGPSSLEEVVGGLFGNHRNSWTMLLSCWKKLEEREMRPAVNQNLEYACVHHIDSPNLGCEAASPRSKGQSYLCQEA